MSASDTFTVVEQEKIRADFPILTRLGRGGKPIAYLDWAATSQKPQAVIDAMTRFYFEHNGAVNRGTHVLADESSEIFYQGRASLADFVGANCPEEIVWTKNSTEALNLIAYALTSPGVNGEKPYIASGDRIVVTRAEHHANLVPWQQAAKRSGAEFAYLDLNSEGKIDLDTLDVITPNTKVVAFTHVSNVTGALSPVGAITAAAKQVGALVVLDTAQSSAHLPLDLKELGIDFACFSAHKMLGPTGIGALWGKDEVLAELPPFLSGGSMIMDVTMENSVFHTPPDRFEAGSQPVAQIAGWQAALEYLSEIGMDRIANHEAQLSEYLMEQIMQVEGVKVIGSELPQERLGLLSFNYRDIHPHDVGQILDAEDVAIRVGHHCALPLHQFFGYRASCRASLHLTTTYAEIDRFIAGLERVGSFFNRA